MYELCAKDGSVGVVTTAYCNISHNQCAGFNLKLLTSIPCIFQLVPINLLTRAYILFIAHLPDSTCANKVVATSTDVIIVTETSSS